MHCDFDWQTTESLFESEYLENTTDSNVLDDYAPSLNTSVLYNHYRFAIPSESTRILLSGNYKLLVFRETDEGDEEQRPIFTACFCVSEQTCGIRATVSGDTDIDYNRSHQQISLQVNLPADVDCSRQEAIKTVVVRNRDYAMAAVNPKPTAVAGSSMEWKHSQELIFPAGNEFRKFEMLSTHVAGMHIDHLNWQPPHYQAEVMVDEVRKNYLYEEDQNGLVVFRSEDAADNDTESDYVLTTFYLQVPEPLPYTIYVSGDWTNYALSDEYRMTYDAETGLYHCTTLLKTGYYNYQYVPRYRNNMPLRNKRNVIEGDFYQTANIYTVFVYYKPNGSRYDRLIGYLTLKS